MISASFWTNTLYKQFKSLALESQRSYVAQTLSFKRKITYHSLLLIGVSHELSSMQDVGHKLHLNVAQEVP